MLLDNITPLILTYNEIANIERTIAPLAWARRILVLDSFSNDGTLEFLRKNPRVDILQRQFDTFASQCNFGLEHIQTEWVLSLDADYICSEALIQEIASLPENPLNSGFQVSFKYCVNGRALRGSLYPPRTVLYRRAVAQYAKDGHAHKVVIRGDVQPLVGFIYHDDRKPLDSWLAAQNRYATQEVEKLRSAPVDSLGFADRLRRAKFIAPFLTPMYCLIGKGLILDGLPGIEYTLQRTYAEILLSLRLAAADAKILVARNAQETAVLSSGAQSDHD